MVEEQKQPGVCGKPCLVWARVVGYYSPIQQWNRGKKAEYRQRRVFAAPALDDPEMVERINAAMVKRFGGF